MKKSDVELSYHQGHHGDPMLNVKNHLWVPELIQRYKGKGNHEFSDDAEFWRWLEEVYENEHAGRFVDMADEWARESCWEMAQEAADEVWPHRAGGSHEQLAWRNRINRSTTGPLKIWSAGRQGGWLVVQGLRPLDEWDAIELGRWAKFAKAVRGIVDDEYPYAFIWNLAVNVFEPIREERKNAYPAPNYAGSNA